MRLGIWGTEANCYLTFLCHLNPLRVTRGTRRLLTPDPTESSWRHLCKVWHSTNHIRAYNALRKKHTFHIKPENKRFPKLFAVCEKQIGQCIVAMKINFLGEQLSSAQCNTAHQCGKEIEKTACHEYWLNVSKMSFVGAEL